MFGYKSGMRVGEGKVLGVSPNLITLFREFLTPRVLWGWGGGRSWEGGILSFPLLPKLRDHFLRNYLTLIFMRVGEGRGLGRSKYLFLSLNPKTLLGVIWFLFLWGSGRGEDLRRNKTLLPLLKSKNPFLRIIWLLLLGKSGRGGVLEILSLLSDPKTLL